MTMLTFAGTFPPKFSKQQNPSALLKHESLWIGSEATSRRAEKQKEMQLLARA
jgi:hypothetical protein